jgi:xanthosine utilization system XapX-like protein
VARLRLFQQNRLLRRNPKFSGPSSEFLLEGYASPADPIIASIVDLVGSLVGKEAAGVAGVALTAVATAIFKQSKRCASARRYLCNVRISNNCAYSRPQVIQR